MIENLQELPPTVENRIKTLLERLELSEIQGEYYKESYEDAARAMLRMENVGWDKITNAAASEGFDLLQLQDVTKSLREWTDTNPLLQRGHEVRCSYLFGAGYTISSAPSPGQSRERGDSGISSRIQEYIDNPVNQAAIFSTTALTTNERSRYTDSIVLALYSKNDHTFSRIPLRDITNVITNPDNLEDVWYYQRSYDRHVTNLVTGETTDEPTVVWYKTDSPTAAKQPTPTKIKDDPVDQRFTVVDDIVGRHAGNTFGTPDCFTAAPWALAYSAYLRDGGKVLAALAEFAWKMTPKSKNGGDRAGAKVKDSSGAGGTLITDMNVAALPRANAVDLSTGRPFAAQVASSLGVSVVILLSDPGQSGAYGTAQTLTDPSIRTLLARQEVNTSFLVRCLKQLGVKRPVIKWEKMSPDADFREMQTISGALGTGLFHADEAREPLAKIAGIALKHDDVPEGYLLPSNANSLALKSIDTDASGADPSGVKSDGSNALVAGQGKPAENMRPSYGINDRRNDQARQ